jgi:hypothetical protein
MSGRAAEQRRLLLRRGGLGERLVDRANPLFERPKLLVGRGTRLLGRVVVDGLDGLARLVLPGVCLDLADVLERARRDDVCGRHCPDCNLKPLGDEVDAEDGRQDNDQGDGRDPEPGGLPSSEGRDG